MRPLKGIGAAVVVAVAAVLPGNAAPSGGIAQNVRPTIVFTKETTTNNGGFISTDAEIYTIDGLDHISQLTDDPAAIDHMPAYAPDGTRIAFVKQSSADASRSGLYVMDANGLDVRKVMDNVGGEGDPAWSPDGRKLAFESNRDGDFDIFVLDLASGAVTKLTDNTVDDRHPAWSPDGTKIAFDTFTTGVDRNREIDVMNADGTGVADLTNSVDCNEQSPDWSSDGTTIAFDGCNLQTGAAGVARMNADGSGMTLVWTDGEAPAYAPAGPTAQSIAYSDASQQLHVDGNVLATGGEPDWQPTAPIAATNGRIAFASDRTGDLEIWTMDANGASPTQLTSSPGDDSFPVWSPTGTQIAFQTARSGNEAIWTMAANGAGAHAVTAGTSFDIEPSWSPNGQRLAFSSDRAGGLDIFTIGVDGSGLTQLTANAGFNNDAEWSPDGTKIAFTSSRNGHDEVFVMNADGSNQQQLTTSSGRDYGPYWSPDGTHIAFQSERDGNSEIYVMDADGANPVRLTNDPGTDSSPSWSPDGSSILFHSNRDGDFEIYVMGANGLGQTALTSNSALDKFADWQPVYTSADVDPPVLSLPPDRTVDATSPAGAVVDYAVSATDAVDPLPTVACVPASGATFPIGTTTVTCTASDVSGNTASGSFTVTVRGAAQQLTSLVSSVLTTIGVPAAARNQLLAALASFNPASPAQKHLACTRLLAFINVVRTLGALHVLPAATAAEWIAEAARIRGVLGC